MFVCVSQGMVEKWLLQVENAMIASVRAVTADARLAYAEAPRNKWVLAWPGQVCYICDAILAFVTQTHFQSVFPFCAW